MSTALRIEVATPNFFSIPLKKVEIETVPATGRTYFLYRDQIVAVAVRGENKPSNGDTTP